ncbi:hypothetical protein MK805_15190 [Shimazuella sp. AN120528]|uniref:hypothetical protein n=1 Tax=Shimazuella soli TaxID=1892854 RepID=UPI001F111315|nr:hypothetical protein [Shimazuella soli]MCH5586286.1 hypothetical protein [Shimazuella soli]
MDVKLNLPVLRQFLVNHEITEIELSNLMEMDRSFIYRVLREQRGPGPKFISRLMSVTGLEFNDLFIMKN